MVKQGDIVLVNFNPQVGHEQKGFRPALIISSDEFIKRARLVIACPITNTNREFPLHISLDERTQTTGFVLCNQLRTLDLNARPHRFIERAPSDILEKALDIVYAELALSNNNGEGTPDIKDNEAETELSETRSSKQTETAEELDDDIFMLGQGFSRN